MTHVKNDQNTEQGASAMNRRLAIPGVVVALVAVMLMAGCSASADAKTYAANWVTPTVNGSDVTIPASVVASKNDVHFKVSTTQGQMGFVAYALNGVTQVRARLCVPCRGESFTLKGDTLVCDACGTIFSATTGKGIGGVQACQSYPKASVPFTTSADGNITMKLNDLQTAYDKTLKRLPQ